jgi:DNA-directed RNA polymerase II subunit RPB1
MDIGPLAKCSFEETTEQIFKAAIFGERDNLDGVSANIMMGQLIPSGTGNTKILLDEMKLLNVKREKQKQEEEKGKDYCSTNLGIDFDIDAIGVE